MSKPANPNSELLRLIRDYCRQRGIATTTFGNLCVKDSRLVERLDAGKPIFTSTATTIHDFIERTRPNASQRRDDAA